MPRRPTGNKMKPGERSLMLKDAFYEDNAFVVRIRTSYNNSSTTTCNAVVMDERLVLSDITCIKYHGLANIDARFVHVLAGDSYNETAYEVEQIYLNKADLRDPGTEVALLKLSKPLKMDSQCRDLIKPEKSLLLESESPVRVIGFTKDQELKENRSRSGKRNSTSKYVCTQPGDIGETPGSSLLRGAPLLHLVDCGQYQLIGVLARTDTIVDTYPTLRKHQDCYILVPVQMKWYESVKTLASLGAKNGATENNNYAPIIVDVESDQVQIESKSDTKVSQESSQKDKAPQ